MQVDARAGSRTAVSECGLASTRRSSSSSCAGAAAAARTRGERRQASQHLRVVIDRHAGYKRVAGRRGAGVKRETSAGRDDEMPVGLVALAVRLDVGAIAQVLVDDPALAGASSRRARPARWKRSASSAASSAWPSSACRRRSR